MLEERDARKTGTGVADFALRIAREAKLPVLVLDPRSRKVEAVNGAFLETFGWEAGDLLGKRYTSLVSEESLSTVRDLVSIVAYGGSRDPENVSLQAGGEDAGEVEVSLVGVPNVLEDPTAPVALLCRPRGQLVGKPVGPPPTWEPNRESGFERIPPADRAQEDRRMNDTSRYLWG